MGTPQSYSAYLAACESGSIESFHALLFDLLRKHGPMSSMGLTRKLEEMGKDISEVRNVATALSAMEVNGLINLTVTSSVVDEFTGRESAVYYVPQEAPTQEDILLRKIKRAETRKYRAETTLHKLYQQLYSSKARSA